MLFNSVTFLIFSAVFFLLWPFLRKRKSCRWIFLVIASFIFYGWWDYRFLLLIMGSGLIDYFAGLAMFKWPTRKKLFLIISIIGNVGSLSIFKYLDFFIHNANLMFEVFGFDYSIPFARFALPIGISFYTFQSMSYTIDIYRGRLKPTRNVMHFFAYLSMFPQLVAGPIVRAAYLLPQLERISHRSEEKRWDGTVLIVCGFFKKAVVADTLAPAVNAAFEMDMPLQSSIYWWIIIIMFGFQIYCDFSGYSDIARGLAKWMGYEFPVNFDHPYISSSFREFWSRWHISLSTWFRDYVYIPLGGNRKNPTLTMRNMWITMLVSGLWHGASWNFVVWGATHSFYLTIEKLTLWPKKLASYVGGRYLGVLIVFILVSVSWVFFRAHSLLQAMRILEIMFDFTKINLITAENYLYLYRRGMLLTCLMVIWHVKIMLNINFGNVLGQNMSYYLKPVIIAMLIIACVFFRGPSSAFIYFQF